MTPQALVEWARQAAKVEFGDDDPMVRLLRSCADLIEAQDATLAAVRDFATPLQIDHRLGDHTQFSRGWEAAKVRVLAILDGTAERP